MSNLWFNIRFGAWHLQGADDENWRKLYWLYNDCHAWRKWHDIEVYEFRLPSRLRKNI